MTLTLAGIAVHEPDVALTDYALALESIIFVMLLMRRRAPDRLVRSVAVALFLSLCLSSLLGGTYHGFFPLRTETTGGWILWIATLLSLGVTAVCLWLLAAALMLDRRAMRPAIITAAVAFALYFLYVTTIDHAFRTGIAFYLPPALALLAVLIRLVLKGNRHAALPGVIGLALTLGAALLQQWKIGLHPAYFNHNALYHLIQAIAIGLLFLSCRSFTGGSSAHARGR